MSNTILITGSTDGIGLETARALVSIGHHVILHGRNVEKLETVERDLAKISDSKVKSYVADLSSIDAVKAFAAQVSKDHETLDVLINNAGVYNVPEPMTKDNLDVRFVVNTISPYILTQELRSTLGQDGRVLNVSSAAQSSVDLKALACDVSLSDHAAYAQSKLAIIMWGHALLSSYQNNGPAIVSVNPGSMLGSKMVKDAFGVDGGDIRVGANILTELALRDDIQSVSGKYFDNDIGRFSSPHSDAADDQKCQDVLNAVEAIIAKL